MVGATKFCRATPLLGELHWLPIAVRVEFKILLLVHRALNGRAPDYVANCVTRRLPFRSLRSSEFNLFCASELSENGETDRSASPTLWNLLPQHLTLRGLSDYVFKGQSKTHFNRTFCRSGALYKFDD